MPILSSCLKKLISLSSPLTLWLKFFVFFVLFRGQSFSYTAVELNSRSLALICGSIKTYINYQRKSTGPKARQPFFKNRNFLQKPPNFAPTLFNFYEKPPNFYACFRTQFDLFSLLAHFSRRVFGPL